MAETPRKVGRPTEYKEEYEELAFNYALLGATNPELAEFFGVSTSTIGNWFNDYPKFLDAVKRGKEEADANVAKSLYKRALGYKTKETRVSSGGENDVISTLEKEVPPDTTAQIFWLKNRQKDKWRDRNHIDHTTNGESINGDTILAQMSEEDLEIIENVYSKYKKDEDEKRTV